MSRRNISLRSMPESLTAALAFASELAIAFNQIVYPERKTLHAPEVSVPVRNPPKLCHPDRSEAKRAEWRDLVFRQFIGAQVKLIAPGDKDAPMKMPAPRPLHSGYNTFSRKDRPLVIVGVPKEIYPGERRVALTPVVVPMLAKAGLEVAIESGAGTAAGYPDGHYQEKGAKILPDRAAVFSQCDIIVQVLCHGANDKTGASDLPLMRRGQLLVGFMRPLASAETVQQIAQTGVTAFSVELMPRTTRAQSMDALSAMASIA